MRGSQANSQISGRIYGILTNSVSGAIAIILFFLFLPRDIIQIKEAIVYLIGNDLINAPVLFVFVVLSYLVGQMVQAYTSYFPFRIAISGVLYFFPYIPHFEREEVNDSVSERFLWTCNKLFHEHTGFTITHSRTYLNDEDINLAHSYLKAKNVPEVQIYEDVSSSFHQLEVLFIISLLLSSLLLHPTNITSRDVQISAFLIPVILFALSTFFIGLHQLLRWIHQYQQESLSHPDLDKRERNKRIKRNILFKRLSGLLFFLAIGSVILLILPLDTNYNSNLEVLFGSLFKYTPFIFLLLVYSSAYVKARYSKMHKLVIIQDLYAVALSEGELREREQD